MLLAYEYSLQRWIAHRDEWNWRRSLRGRSLIGFAPFSNPLFATYRYERGQDSDRSQDPARWISAWVTACPGIHLTGLLLLAYVCVCVCIFFSWLFEVSRYDPFGRYSRSPKSSKSQRERNLSCIERFGFHWLPQRLQFNGGFVRATIRGVKSRDTI